MMGVVESFCETNSDVSSDKALNSSCLSFGTIHNVISFVQISMLWKYQSAGEEKYINLNDHQIVFNKLFLNIGSYTLGNLSQLIYCLIACPK